MIDYFALALGHGLLAIAFLRLVMRSDLDDDPSFHARPETSETSEPSEPSEPREEVNRAAARSLLRRQNQKRLASQDQREGGG